MPDLPLESADLPLSQDSVVRNGELNKWLDSYALETIVEMKISRFLDQIGTYYPEDLHALLLNKCEKPIMQQILHRVGGNQVQAAAILGINRNTLRKKIKQYGIQA
jgi:Fis family transcriptional regulator